MTKSRVTQQATGKWRAVLSQLGINDKILDGKHHPCPSSGEGSDRFRFSNKGGKGNFFCACNDGRGDGFKLLECVNGWDFKTAAFKVEEVLGDCGEDAEDAKKIEHAIRDLRMIQRKVGSTNSDEKVVAYLKARGIDTDKHYRRGVLFDAAVNYGLRSIGILDIMDAMVAKVLTPKGEPSTYHLTYLDGTKKANIERNRVVATPIRPMAGGAVRLMPMGEDGMLGVAEGIETSFSAAQMFSLPVWATLNAMQMSKFVPPPGCKRLVIFADNDRSYTGQAAAYALAKNCVLKHGIEAVVEMPAKQGTDWNDVLISGGV